MRSCLHKGKNIDLVGIQNFLTMYLTFGKISAMYHPLLVTHSFFRWLVLASLLFALYRSYTGWLGKKPFNKLDNTTRIITSTIVHIQLLLGLALYFISPIVQYFLNNFKEGMAQREIRFFGMEHITMMLLGIILITIGSAKAKRKEDNVQKHKTIAIWFTIGLLVILSSIPWAFSPLISRPWFRWF